MRTLLDALDVTGQLLYWVMLLSVIVITLLYGHPPAVIHLTTVPAHR